MVLGEKHGTNYLPCTKKKLIEPYPNEMVKKLGEYKYAKVRAIIL